MKIWRMTFRTRHFDFEAFGKTAMEARIALNKGLTEHGKQYKLPSTWYVGDDGVGAFTDPEEIVLGVAYRDGQKLAPRSARRG